MVNAFSEESSLEQGEEPSSGGAEGYSLPVALRHARKTEEEKKRQEALKKTLMEGSSPAKFCDALNSVQFIRTETTKDSGADLFIKAVTKIGRDLDKINRAYLAELNPVSLSFAMSGLQKKGQTII